MDWVRQREPVVQLIEPVVPAISRPLPSMSLSRNHGGLTLRGHSGRGTHDIFFPLRARESHAFATNCGLDRSLDIVSIEICLQK